MIAADQQATLISRSRNTFPRLAKNSANGHAHSPFNTPVRIDKLPAEARQLAANMTLAAHHADENDIPYIIIGAPPQISILCICTPLFYHNFFSLTQKTLYFSSSYIYKWSEFFLITRCFRPYPRRIFARFYHSFARVRLLPLSRASMAMDFAGSMPEKSTLCLFHLSLFTSSTV